MLNAKVWCLWNISRSSQEICKQLCELNPVGWNVNMNGQGLINLMFCKTLLTIILQSFLKKKSLDYIMWAQNVLHSVEVQNLYKDFQKCVRTFVSSFLNTNPVSQIVSHKWTRPNQFDVMQKTSYNHHAVNLKEDIP